MSEPIQQMPVQTVPVEKKEGPSRLGLILGALFIITCGFMGAALAEVLLASNRIAGLGGGALAGVLLLALTRELGKLKIGVLAGGAAGLLFGLLAALLVCSLIGAAFPQNVRPWPMPPWVCFSAFWALLSGRRLETVIHRLSRRKRKMPAARSTITPRFSTPASSSTGASPTSARRLRRRPYGGAPVRAQGIAADRRFL